MAEAADWLISGFRLVTLLGRHRYSFSHWQMSNYILFVILAASQDNFGRIGNSVWASRKWVENLL
jgi:hypothetical protein